MNKRTVDGEQLSEAFRIMAELAELAGEFEMKKEHKNDVQLGLDRLRNRMLQEADEYDEGEVHYSTLQERVDRIDIGEIYTLALEPWEK